jgi:hypothetical protein
VGWDEHVSVMGGAEGKEGGKSGREGAAKIMGLEGDGT